MYLSAKNLRWVTANLLQEAAKLINAPYDETFVDPTITIKYSKQGRFHKSHVYFCRFRTQKENRVLATIRYKPRQYPQDFFELIKDDNGYRVVNLDGPTREDYDHPSLEDIEDSVTVSAIAYNLKRCKGY